MKRSNQPDSVRVEPHQRSGSIDYCIDRTDSIRSRINRVDQSQSRDLVRNSQIPTDKLAFTQQRKDLRKLTNLYPKPGVLKWYGPHSESSILHFW